MQLPADYHMHTHLCRHAQGTASDLAERAVDFGLPEIGLSEHAPMIRDDWDDWHMLQAELDAYLGQMATARQTYPQMPLKAGLEVDFIPGHEGWIRQLASRHSWDYLIGAVHYVSDTWALDNPHRMDEWKSRNPFEVWKIYFDRLSEAATSGLFDIIAHADLCKKFCFYPKEDCRPLYERFILSVKRGGVAMELNTAGLRKDCREIYPAPDIVRLAFTHDVPITFASDAHAPGEVGANFAEAVALARSAGYTKTCRFNRRQRTIVPL